MSLAMSTSVMFISAMLNLNGAQFLYITFILGVYAAASGAVVFPTVKVPLTSIYASL